MFIRPRLSQKPHTISHQDMYFRAIFLISPATIKRILVFMYSGRYFCSILTKFGLCRQIFIKIPNIKFHENPSSQRCADTYGRTDIMKLKLTGAFCNYVEAPKNNSVICVNRVIQWSICMYTYQRLLFLILSQLYLSASLYFSYEAYRLHQVTNEIILTSVAFRGFHISDWNFTILENWRVEWRIIRCNQSRQSAVPLRAFPKLRKAITSFVCLSVCLYVHSHGTTRLPRDRFSRNLASEYFSKIYSERKVSLKSDTHNGHFTWRHMYLYDMSLNTS
jgi:hypothetical protein